MVKHLASIGLFGALTTCALASFEMLLVADNGANTTPTRRIHRFDPDSGVYLGAFGNFSSDIQSIEIRQSRNEAYVTAGSTLYVFDYNTGALKKDFGGWVFTDVAFSQDDSTFYAVGGTSSIYKTTTAFMDAGSFSPAIWVNDASATMTSVAVTWGNKVMTGQTRSGQAAVYSYDATNPGTGTGVTGFNPGVVLGAAATIGGGGSLQALSYSGLGYAYRYGSSGFGSSFYYTSQIGTATAASAAHSGAYLVGIDAATPTQGLITRFANSGAEMQSFGGSVLRKPIAMASVLAPEPGTMIALGAGITALLRRRKRSLRRA